MPESFRLATGSTSAIHCGERSLAKTWAILKSMLDPMNTKTTTTRTLRTLAGEFKGDDDALLRILRDKYIGSGGETIQDLDYKGSENQGLDAPISEQEVFAAAMSRRRLRERTAKLMRCCEI